MTDRPIITGEAAEAAAVRMHNALIAEAEYDASWEAQPEPIRRYWREKARALLIEHYAHVEGERLCERCGGSGKRKIDLTPCPDCKGTGKVRADRLVSLNAVVEALGRDWVHGGDKCADFIERNFKEADDD